MTTGSTQPLRPAGTVMIPASSTSATTGLSGGGGTVLVYNASAATAFFRLGAAAGLTALPSDTPVPPGARLMVDGGPFVTYAAAILSNGTGSVYFTQGSGDTY